MIKPIHAFLFLFTLAMFGVLLLFGINVDMSAVNTQRDVSTLNQRFSNITNIDERFAQQDAKTKQQIDATLTAFSEKQKALMSQTEASNKALLTTIQKDQQRIQQLELADQRNRQLIDQLQRSVNDLVDKR